MRKTSCWMLPAVLLALAGCSPTASTGSDVPAQAEQDPLAAAVDKTNTDYSRLRVRTRTPLHGKSPPSGTPPGAN